MRHAPSITAPITAANVKPLLFPDSEMATSQTSLLSIPELVGEEIHAWAARQRASTPGASLVMLMHALATRLGLQNERQIYRYMSGETPFPVEKLVPLCVAIGSWKLLQALNQDAGLVAEPKPDVGKLESFDLIVEQARNLREFGELVSAYAAASDAAPSGDTLRRIEKEGREVIQQVERLVAIYRELVAARTRS